MIIQIPGSSANLGPGFDCFGIAWQLYNKIEFLPCEDGLKISGCPQQFQNEENLAYLGYQAVTKAAGIKVKGLEINFLDTQIPVCRGLGSSAALIVGGAVAANKMHKLNLSRQQLLELSTPVEGHPDNIAPSVFGGFTASTAVENKVASAFFMPSSKLHFTALIPDFKLSTQLSRSVLPQSYSKADTVFNIARAAMLPKAFESGDMEMISYAMQDKIHQPYRTELIAGYKEAEDIALSLGARAVCISGAGPTMLCVCDDASFSSGMKAAMLSRFPGWQVLELFVDTNGAVCI